MLQIQHLRKDYGATTILSDITAVVNNGEHVGLIGPNGAGKSTLLRCIVGTEQPDTGVVVRAPADLTIGYLPQTLDLLRDQRVGEAIAAAQTAFFEAEATLQRAADALAIPGDMEVALSDYDRALTRFEALGGYEREHHVAAVLEGLGLGQIDQALPVAALSGGQKTRLGLALLLFSEPDLLVLDEPTNHLDVEALEWLESFVRSYPHTVLVVSHDRAFLDRTVTRILYLDPETHALSSYTGNYTAFVEARQHERALHTEAWKKQQDYVEKVEGDIARLKGQSLGVELSTTPAQPEIRKVAKKVAKKAKSRERKLERYLESDERVEKPKQTWGLKLDFGPPPAGGRAVLRLDDVAFAYPGGAPLFQHIELNIAYGERIALVGPNGAGKTTLLRVIAGQLAPTGGTVHLGANVRLGVLAQEHETLDLQRTVLDTVRAVRAMGETEARNFLHFFLFGGERVFRRVSECSLGERSRLQLATLVLQGCNLLLLDEPLNHLDIEGREHFENALEAFEGTVLAVAHDRAFLRSFAERVIEVRDGHVRNIAGGYEG